MKYFKTLFTVGILGFLVSCGNQSALFPGFSVTKSNIHYKLVTIGESDVKAKPTDFVNVLISYRTPSDSLFFTGTRTFQLTEPQFIGSVDECFTMLAAGDSATFYLSALDFFTKTIEAAVPQFFKSDDFIRVDIKMLGIMEEKTYALEKETFLHWIEDFGEYEKVLLKQYINEQTNDFEQTASGIYYIPIEQGTGKKIQLGDTLTVHYEGRFFNGRYFDSTRKRNEAFQFVYGQKWQVIPGLEEAISMMYPQERALFIIPSHLAFGQGGSSTGIVPAFTPVIFEVEVMEVKTKN